MSEQMSDVPELPSAGGPYGWLIGAALGLGWAVRELFSRTSRRERPPVEPADVLTAVNELRAEIDKAFVVVAADHAQQQRDAALFDQEEKRIHDIITGYLRDLRDDVRDGRKAYELIADDLRGSKKACETLGMDVRSLHDALRMLLDEIRRLRRDGGVEDAS